MDTITRFFFILLVAVTACHGAVADPPLSPPATAADSSGTYIVGVIQAPPFAMKDQDGNWDGIAIRLWRHIAADLGIQFELRELPIPELVRRLEQRHLVAVVAAIVSAEREKLVDFSHPYYTSRLGIAVPATSDSPDWLAALSNLVSWGFLKIIGVLLAVLMLAGALIWVFERRANSDHFSQRPIRGLADGLWWAAVTMTTVGYGDKAPRTHLGRVVGGVWMFVAVVLISLFTAHVTSTLTVSHLSGRVRGPSDLPHVRVGTLQDSAIQEQLLSALGVATVGYTSFAAGLTGLARGEIDAFVAGEPILRYGVAKQFQGQLQVLPSSFMREDFAFALPLDSPLRRDINASLLGYIESDEWAKMVRSYLGHER